MNNPQLVKALRDGPDAWNQVINGYDVNKPMDLAGEDLTAVRLNGIEYPGRAIFDNCTFDTANLEARFLRGASFKKARFIKPIRFALSGIENATVNFHGAVFEGLVDLAVFYHASEVTFTDATFEDDVRCKGSGAWLGQDISFSNATIKKSLHFSNVELGHGQFVRMKVEGSVSFESCTFKRGATFEEAAFKSEARFENVKFQGSSSFRTTRFSMAPNFHNADLHAGTQFPLPHEFPKFFPDTDSPAAAERYRTLKLAMNKQHALSEEAGFFLLEMRSRAKQEPFSRRFLYRCYDILSDYGQSVRRPLLWFLAVNLAFGLVYSVLSGQRWETIDPQLLSLTLFGAVPFAAALRWPEVTPVIQPHLFPDEFAAIAQGAIVMQSLLSGIFLFLIGLGLRNMFKIK